MVQDNLSSAISFMASGSSLLHWPIFGLIHQLERSHGSSQIIPQSRRWDLRSGENSVSLWWSSKLNIVLEMYLLPCQVITLSVCMLATLVSNIAQGVVCFNCRKKHTVGSHSTLAHIVTPRPFSAAPVYERASSAQCVQLPSSLNRMKLS